MYDPEIRPEAQDYYDRTDLEPAIQATKERIEEWSYDDDPHGYCHERPLLVALIREHERLRRGIERLAAGRCDCDVSHLGGHDYGCSSRIETVDRDDLWALLEHEEPTDG